MSPPSNSNNFLPHTSIHWGHINPNVWATTNVRTYKEGDAPIMHSIDSDSDSDIETTEDCLVSFGLKRGDKVWDRLNGDGPWIIINRHDPHYNGQVTLYDGSVSSDESDNPCQSLRWAYPETLTTIPPTNPSGVVTTVSSSVTPHFVVRTASDFASDMRRYARPAVEAHRRSLRRWQFANKVAEWVLVASILSIIGFSVGFFGHQAYSYFTNQPQPLYSITDSEKRF